MGIGSRDYSHRSSQRSSLRELGEVERGQRRSGVGHASCVAKASGGWAIRVGSALQRTIDGANPRALNSTTCPPSKPLSIAGSESEGGRRWRALTERAPVPSG